MFQSLSPQMFSGVTHAQMAWNSKLIITRERKYLFCLGEKLFLLVFFKKKLIIPKSCSFFEGCLTPEQLTTVVYAVGNNENMVSYSMGRYRLCA